MTIFSSKFLPLWAIFYFKDDTMRVAILQLDLVWEDKAANLAQIDAELAALQQPIDWVVLPEMFTTGFSMNAAALAEPTDLQKSPTLKAMHKWAQRYRAVVFGSMIAMENGQYYNRMMVVSPNGDQLFYDKINLFGLGNETAHYTAGKQRIFLQHAEWIATPLICYDLRFPEVARNAKINGKPLYDALIYVANWPATRAEHWRTLLRARAIENQAYCIGVNRVGTDGNGLTYSGDSAVIDPLGNTVAEITGKSGTLVVEISKSHLDMVREKLPFLKFSHTTEL
jgi:omega-amidase